MRLCKGWLAGIWLFTASSLSGQLGQVREWTSADGRKLTARLVRITAEGVLISANGKRFTLELDALSEGDREFVASLAPRVEGGEERSRGFEEGKYAAAVKGEWVKYGKEDLGLLFQLFIGREVTRKKAGPAVPLIIHLHGASARADEVQAGKVEIAPEMLSQEEFYHDHPCVICVPTCPPEPETWGKQTAKLEAIVDDLVANLPIDRNRIYLSGYSQGAQGIGKMLVSRPDFYAASIFADGGPSDSWLGRVKTPMWSYFSGERDSSKAPEHQAGFAAEGVEYRFNILPDAEHNGIHWKLAKDPKVFAWVFEQVKK